MKVQVIKKGITTFKVDAIVNAANKHLSRSAGVCSSIFQDCGDLKLQKECEEIGYCSTGSAVITNCYGVNAKKIIHAVGPVYKNTQSDDYLYNAYYNSLLLADENELSSIAFPSISTGGSGFPLRRASKIALKAVFDFEMKHQNSALKEIYFSVIDNTTCYYFEKAVKEYKDAYSSIQELFEDMNRYNQICENKYIEMPFYYMFLNKEITKEDLLDRLSYFENVTSYENVSSLELEKIATDLTIQIEDSINQAREKNIIDSFEYQKDSIWFYWKTKISFWMGGEPDFDSMPKNFENFYFGKPPAYGDHFCFSFIKGELYNKAKYAEFLKSDDFKAHKEFWTKFREGV